MTRDEALAQIPGDARPLDALTAELDADLHDVYLAQDGQVWWAYQEPGEDTWTVETMTARKALRTFAAVLDALRDRQVDPLGYDDYPHPDRRRESDDETLADFAEIELADLPSDPRRADEVMRRRIAEARWDAGRWADVRAALVRRIAGSDRGGQNQAAKLLGLSEQAISKIVRRR